MQGSEYRWDDMEYRAIADTCREEQEYKGHEEAIDIGNTGARRQTHQYPDSSQEHDGEIPECDLGPTHAI